MKKSQKKSGSFIGKVFRVFLIISICVGVFVGSSTSNLKTILKSDIINVPEFEEMLDSIKIEENCVVETDFDDNKYVEFEFDGETIQCFNIVESAEEGDKLVVIFDKTAPEEENFAFSQDMKDNIGIITGLIAGLGIFIILVQISFPFFVFYVIIKIVLGVAGSINNMSQTLGAKKPSAQQELNNLIKNNMPKSVRPNTKNINEDHYSSAKTSSLVDKDDCISCDKEEKWSKSFFGKKEADSYNDIEEFYKSKNKK